MATRHLLVASLLIAGCSKAAPRVVVYSAQDQEFADGLFADFTKRTGLTVTPRAVSELSRAINRLLHEDDLRRQYGRAAMHRVDSEFSVEKMASCIRALYMRMSGAAAVVELDAELSLRAAL